VTRAVRRVDIATARRMAVEAQRLSGPLARSTPATILDVVRSIRCVQIDPTAVVARTQHLVLRSRLDRYDPEQLPVLAYTEHALFEYWAHAASYVLTEDWPVHHLMMRTSERDGGWSAYSRQWLSANEALRANILRVIRRHGPVRLRDLAELVDDALVSWQSTGWTGERNLDQMLRILWTMGKILVADRRGLERWWDLAERVVPRPARGTRLSDAAVVRRAVELSVRGLGLGTLQHVKANYTRDRYPNLKEVLGGLVRRKVLEPVEVEGVPGTWFVHAEDVPMLERIEAGGWAPRTTMLSPFDNLIADRKRASALFDLEYRIEIYTPKDKRRYGYFAMPVLDGDRFIARVDPAFARDERRLDVMAVHAEPGFERSKDAARAVGAAVRDLATWLGAERVDLAGAIPRGWRTALS
jgi:uncharacterized protein